MPVFFGFLPRELKRRVRELRSIMWFFKNFVAFKNSTKNNYNSLKPQTLHGRNDGTAKGLYETFSFFRNIS